MARTPEIDPLLTPAPFRSGVCTIAQAVEHLALAAGFASAVEDPFCDAANVARYVEREIVGARMKPITVLRHRKRECSCPARSAAA